MGNCSITSWGRLPKIDKNGKVPDVHPPKPKPKPLTDCVKLYGWEGFSSKPILEPCDSVPELENYFFYGAMFPKKLNLEMLSNSWPSLGNHAEENGNNQLNKVSNLYKEMVSKHSWLLWLL